MFVKLPQHASQCEGILRGRAVDAPQLSIVRNDMLAHNSAPVAANLGLRDPLGQWHRCQL
jgi:hypothetical protein